MSTTITTTYTSNEIDSDLCHLVATLSLNNIRSKERENPSLDPRISRDAQDAIMSNSDCQSPPDFTSCTRGEIFGCPLLQAIQSQLDTYSTTAGDYLDTIFTHRAVFTAFPKGHVECARGFSDLAFSLERRAARADREEDLEAVKAFRYEAWVIANSI